MQRLTFGVISIIIMFTAFMFLWMSNPLYAFVGAVVFVVFLLVGFAFLLNLPKREEASTVEKELMPRRTGEFKRIEHVEKPEASWEHSDSTQHIAPVESEKKETKPPLAPPPPQAAPKPDLSPGYSQGLRTPPAPAPAPPEPEPRSAPAKPADQSVPDFDKMEPEEMMEGTESLAKGQGASEGFSTGADIEDTDGDVSGEPLARGDYKPFGVTDEDWQQMLKRRAREDETLDTLSDMEPTGGLDISDNDRIETKEELADARLDFDDGKQDSKQKLELGSFGDSTEEMQTFFDTASEESTLEDDGDFFDDEDSDSDFFGGGADVDMEEDLGIADEVVVEASESMVKEEVPPIDVSNKPASTGSNNFDLMGMIGSLPPDKQQEFYALISDVPIGDQTETQLIRIYEQLMGSANDDGQNLSEAQFTAYYPRQAAANTEYGLYVYAHLPNALIAADVQQFESQLGGRVPKPKVAQETAKIQEGATLSVMLHCDKLKFNQVGAMQQWHAPFVRFDFKFTAEEALVDEIIEGRIAILMGMIEIASIDLHVAIVPVNSLAVLTAIPQDPLTAQNYDATASASLYQKIFISYSRNDSIIAEHYRKVQMMAGNIIFMDTHSIRAGEDWEIALKRFIDEADVFQLFWSQHSAASNHVRFEWEYALTHRCADTRCVQFIRPAYWEKPLIDIPSELNHLHFAFVEMKLD